MTMHVTRQAFSQPFVTRDHVAEKNAFVRLARGRMRRAIGYRKWALEARAEGKRQMASEYNAESRRQIKRAWDAMSFARLEASYHG